MTESWTANTAGMGVDLTNCDREPIHLLGRVQSYGALMAVSSDWIVQHASENLGTVLGIEAETVLGQPLTDLIVADSFDRIRQNLQGVHVENGSVRLFGIVLRPTGGVFDLSLHQSGRHLIVELEPRAVRSGTDVMSEVYPHIRAIQTQGDLGALVRDAARGMRALTGFDSVMVYQFQPDGSGRVLAEERADGQRVYLGLAFPASDIPAQARLLYQRNLLRLIADVSDPGAAIVPPATIDGQPLDLSLSVTRAVSPIHIEYLKNMGVEASMSVSILKDGALWGLFACHHHQPHYVDYERRTAVELYAHLFAYELSRFEDTARARVEREMNALQTRLMALMASGRPLSQSLLSVSTDIASVIPHDGLVLYSDEEFQSTGAAPAEEEFRGIARALDRSVGSGIFATEHLARLHPDAASYADRCAGILAIPVSRRPRDYLVLCRRQVLDTVSWAGNPAKPVSIGPNGSRLTPRKSFEVWRETVEGRSQPWSDQSCHAAELLRTVLLEIFLKVTDAANEERKRSQQQQTLLISELNHRVRNILNLIRGLVAQTKGTASSLGDFTENLDGRIHALARAHDQLTSERWEPASLRSLIECEFAAYAVNRTGRVVITGPDAMIEPKAYTTLALVLHEMATNSIKYGALCDNSGRVELDLSTDANGALLINWRERGGPPVTRPGRRGFGTTIIESSIPHELRGDAEVDYKITGLEARFRIPAFHISRIVEPDPVAGASSARPAAAAGASVLEGRALVLEDTLIIALDAADLLRDLGASDVSICSSVAEALATLEERMVDFALLDVNLGDEQSLAVAEWLHRSGVPFVLATGYGDTADIIQSYPPCEIVQKPFTAPGLADAIARTRQGSTSQ